jgi:hypothetical protein
MQTPLLLLLPLLLPLLVAKVAKAVAAEPDGARTGPVGNLSGP